MTINAKFISDSMYLARLVHQLNQVLKEKTIRLKDLTFNNKEFL